MIMKSDERKKFWTDHYYRWQESGKTQRDYCKEEGINYHTFKYNRSRNRAENQMLPVALPKKFIQVPPTQVPEIAFEPAKRIEGEICIHVGEAFKVSVDDAFLPQTLKTVISVLKEF